MAIDVDGALQDLAKAADHLAALLEWEKLAEQERGSRALPPFRLRDHNREDILDLYGQFVNLSKSLHNVLDSTDVGFTSEQWDLWREQLRKLDTRVRGFDIIAKYIKP